jgi:hypothetical protein
MIPFVVCHNTCNNLQQWQLPISSGRLDNLCNTENSILSGPNGQSLTDAKLKYSELHAHNCVEKECKQDWSGKPFPNNLRMISLPGIPECKTFTKEGIVHPLVLQHLGLLQLEQHQYESLHKFHNMYCGNKFNKNTFGAHTRVLAWFSQSVNWT